MKRLLIVPEQRKGKKRNGNIISGSKRNGNGNFQAFIESCGYTKQTVHNLIGRYNLIVQNLDNKQLIEQLPLSVTYEIASPSADPELKEKVLSGEITSRKEMEAWKEEKKKILAEKEQDKNDRWDDVCAKVKTGEITREDSYRLYKEIFETE